MTIPSEPGGGRLDPGLGAVMSERRQLINLAYRLLGSLADAEVVVSEAPSWGFTSQPCVFSEVATVAASEETIFSEVR
ncbi:hypothetical protein [Nonomuraea dietziae]|uniref:hypothetical protein n=1 Tax=Nonomuraea dietziae TaxID=65515 RepID=UPI0033DD5629